MGQKHLTLGDRVKIETLIREHYNLSDIANQLGYSRATITKEIHRSINHATMGMKVSTRISRRMYNALEAQTLANQKQRHKKLAPSKLTKRRQKLVKDYIINKKWSPEQSVLIRLFQYIEGWYKSQTNSRGNSMHDTVEFEQKYKPN